MKQDEFEFGEVTVGFMATQRKGEKHNFDDQGLMLQLHCCQIYTKASILSNKIFWDYLLSANGASKQHLTGTEIFLIMMLLKRRLLHMYFTSLVKPVGVSMCVMYNGRVC